MPKGYYKRQPPVTGLNKCKDLSGERFGFWVVLRFSHRKGRKDVFFTCQCACGVMRDVRSSALTSGQSRCCGCVKNKRENKPIEERFWPKVKKGKFDECWEWQASTQSFGYGQIMINKKPIRAHRLSYEIHFGKIPKGNIVMHTCDNPPCVNPAHLMIGTKYDNAMDKETKGRGGQDIGEACHNAILTEKDVKNIRNLYKTGKYSMSDLARKFNLSSSGSINRIIHKQSWKHVK